MFHREEMNYILVVSLLLVAVTNAVPVPRHTTVYKTSSIYPNYEYHHQPFPFNPYPDPLFQSTYVHNPLALNSSIERIFEPHLKTANEGNKETGNIERKSLVSLFAKPVTGGEKLKIKLIGETDHGTINLVNPFIAHKPPAKGQKVEEDGVVINGSETDVHVPFFHAHLDPIFGPEIAPKYEIHYLPHNFNYADFSDQHQSFESPSFIPNVELDHHSFITSNVNAPQSFLFPAINHVQSAFYPDKQPGLSSASDASVKHGNGQSGTDQQSSSSVPKSGDYPPLFSPPQTGNESPTLSPIPTQSDSTETTTPNGEELTSSQSTNPELQLGADSKNEEKNSEPGIVGALPPIDSSKPVTELFAEPVSYPSKSVQKNDKRATVVIKKA